MYFVDREKIQQTLTYMEQCIDLFESQEKWELPIEQLGLERIAHSFIEAVIDVGNSMIDGFIMRDPGGYEDIVDILEDEKVLSSGQAGSIKNVVRYRKPLVQSYIAINHEELLDVIQKNLEALKKFPHSVRTYLEVELGPVSAFLPEENK
ncbi:DUF86 domain-containing protein [Bacillus sp. FJAT-45350]|uniref:DUF86 domain-containing protein n=1 Tax=Bacillus sp. FJAT-45350 TaxID=2011014 RepID=UPI000BB73C78|nr:DUF86 domain-containing protein [Bacillus sp. FJAT-45350]